MIPFKISVLRFPMERWWFSFSIARVDRERVMEAENKLYCMTYLYNIYIYIYVYTVCIIPHIFSYVYVPHYKT